MYLIDKLYLWFIDEFNGVNGELEFSRLSLISKGVYSIGISRDNFDKKILEDFERF
jgi:hypothetical protein